MSDWDAVADPRDARLADAEASVARDKRQDRLVQLEFESARRARISAGNIQPGGLSSDESEDPVLAESARLLAQPSSQTKERKT